MYSRARAGWTNDRSIDRFCDPWIARTRTIRLPARSFRSSKDRLSLAGNVAEGGAFCIAFEIRFDVILTMLFLWSLQRGFLFSRYIISIHSAVAFPRDDDLPKTNSLLGPSLDSANTLPSSSCIHPAFRHPVQSRVNNIHERSREWFFYACTRRTNRSYDFVISKKAKKIYLYENLFREINN